MALLCDVFAALGPRDGVRIGRPLFDPVPYTSEIALAALAAKQHGVVTRQQLMRLGLGERAIYHLSRWAPVRVHLGVYAVGRPPNATRAHQRSRSRLWTRGRPQPFLSPHPMGLDRVWRLPLHVTCPDQRRRRRSHTNPGHTRRHPHPLGTASHHAAGARNSYCTSAICGPARGAGWPSGRSPVQRICTSLQLLAVLARMFHTIAGQRLPCAIRPECATPRGAVGAFGPAFIQFCWRTSRLRDPRDSMS